MEVAVDKVLSDGYRTADLARQGERTTTTEEMSAAIIERIMEANLQEV